jgi:hypothetical protein
MRVILSSLGLVGTLALSPAGAQEATLAERAALAEDEVVLGTSIESSSPSVSELVAEADLIVDGVVLPRTSYLSTDGTLIYSDYPIRLIQVLVGSTMPVDHPGVINQIVVTHLGGELQLQGKRVRVYDPALWRRGISPCRFPAQLMLT